MGMIFSTIMIISDKTNHLKQAHNTLQLQTDYLCYYLYYYSPLVIYVYTRSVTTVFIRL